VGKNTAPFRWGSCWWLLRGVFVSIEQSDANKKLMTKLPAKLFCDFSRNGALARILCCALRYKNELVSLSLQ
jgi:hypothetical protein